MLIHGHYRTGNYSWIRYLLQSKEKELEFYVTASITRDFEHITYVFYKDSQWQNGGPRSLAPTVVLCAQSPRGQRPRCTAQYQWLTINCTGCGTPEFRRTGTTAYGGRQEQGSEVDKRHRKLPQARRA